MDYREKYTFGKSFGEVPGRPGWVWRRPTAVRVIHAGGMYGRIQPGDVGGYVAVPPGDLGSRGYGIYPDGECWVMGDARLWPDSLVERDAVVGGNAEVSGSTISGRSIVQENALVVNSSVYCRALVRGNAILHGATLSADDVEIDGNSHIIESELFGKRVYIADARIVDLTLYDAEIRGKRSKVWDDGTCPDKRERHNVYTPPEVYHAALGSWLHSMMVASTTSEDHLAYLTRVSEGDTDYRISIGCYVSNSVGDLREMVQSSDWPSGSDEGILRKARPEMLALVDLMEARIERWRGVENVREFPVEEFAASLRALGGFAEKTRRRHQQYYGYAEATK